MDSLTIGFLGGVLLILLFATTAIYILRRKADYGIDPAVLETLHSRVRAWWLLFGSLVGAFLLGPLVTILLFIVISFWAFQEYITLTPTRPADNNTLSFVIFGLPLLQFLLVGLDRDWFYYWFQLDSYLIFSILIPAYVFLIVPAFIAMSGDAKHFLERIAKIQVGLLICVYSLSFAPALLTMELPQTNETKVVTPLPGGVEAKVVRDLHLETQNNADGTQTPLLSPRPKTKYANLRLLFFLILIVQLNDIVIYLWSQIRSRHLIAPAINSTRTWEGVIGGTATTTLLGTALWWFTPLAWWQAGFASMLVSLMGLAGGLTMSAIKRDCGVDDYGTLIEGHSGVLDRIDSLCFAAPVFYHVVWILTHVF
ncbi:MAG: phosphatidate cytidylyltransferase [Planctomycetaceae bacterium]|nr:phosphatidate cytidylyltransferase [Planctomycetaceae bacterium]